MTSGIADDVKTERSGTGIVKVEDRTCDMNNICPDNDHVEYLLEQEEQEDALTAGHPIQREALNLSFNEVSTTVIYYFCEYFSVRKFLKPLFMNCTLHALQVTTLFWSLLFRL